MSIRFIIILCILFIFFLISKVGKKKMELRLCLPWMFISFILILATVFNQALLPIKDFLGFEELSNMVFLLGFLSLALIVLSLTSKISLLNAKVIELTQELAILKKEQNNEKNHK